MATHFVKSEHLGGVIDELRAGVPMIEVLGAHRDRPASDLPLRKVGEYFADENVSAIVGGLRGAVGDDWAADMIGLIENASPTSLWVAAAMIEAGSVSTLDECFDRELHAAEQITRTADFAEGVRAVLVDKDRRPTFEPASVDDVDPGVVARIIGAV